MTIRRIMAVHSDGIERYVEYDDERCTLTQAREALGRCDPGAAAEWARKMWQIQQLQMRMKGNAT